MADLPIGIAVDQMTDRLYELPPERFTVERAAAVAAANASGEPAAAAHLAGLRKPTIAAWLVNLLALRRPDLIDDLFDLARALREAQRDLRGDDLRELTVGRRHLLSTLVAQARRLAVAAGRPPGAALPLADVERTLAAAMADPEIAAEVRAGRLIRAAGHSGFGGIPRPRLRLIAGGPAAAVEPVAGRFATGGAQEEVAPVGPAGTVGPVAPAGTVAPLGPAGTVGPIAPAGTVAPVGSDPLRAEAAAAEAELACAAAAERDAARRCDELQAALADLNVRRALAADALNRAGRDRRMAERKVAWCRRRLDTAAESGAGT